MNPQSIFHAYAMTYIELEAARADGRSVPPSILARLAGSDPVVVRSVMRAIKDVERSHPMRSKPQLVLMFGGAASPVSRPAV